VKLRIELWRSEEIDLLLSSPASTGTFRNRGRCSHGFFDDLEKCLCLFTQGTVTRVDYIEAPAQRFGVQQLDRDQLSRPEFLAYS
jgi:hypothetical protein